jgi:diguanylate cyclase (GGDEF)-like protein/PAS domain S-box-containing protein
MDGQAVTTDATSSWESLGAKLRSWLPSGQTLPPEEFARRHRWLLAFLWLQVPILAAYGLLRGYDLDHLLIHGLPIVAFATLGTVHLPTQRLRAVSVAMGLFTCAAVAVHTSGGLIEAHFYFFVVIVLLTLYEDWVPFLVALGYVVLHHGALGAIDRDAVYDHGGNPWLYALVHGGFVLAAGTAAVLAWRLNEDVRRQKDEATRALQESEQRFRALTASAPVGIFETDGNGQCLYVNERWSELTGLSEEQALGRGWLNAVHPEDRANVDLSWKRAHGLGEELSIDFRYMRTDGRAVWVSCRVVPSKTSAEGVHGYLGTIADVSELKQVEEWMTELALRDELTGLPNRRHFQQELGAHVGRARRSGWQGALLALDLDGFKAVNDTQGHAAGDQLLRRTTEKLQGRLRSSDFIARLGGDEFAVLLHDADVTAARIVADTLVTALACEDTDELPGTTTSIGIALVDGPINGEELMIRADVALYAAKDRGGSSFMLYNPGLDRRFETEALESEGRPDTFAVTRSRQRATT